ncbi:MAG: F0F1 ATP synthase subunit delta [Patescibacteria group bacterium]
MQYSSKEYARALYEVIRGMKDKEAEQAIVKFVADMKSRGLLALLPEILKALPTTIKMVDGIEDVVIESAHDLDDATVAGAVKALGKKQSEVEVRQIINPEIIGGIKVRGRDTVLDASLRGRIQKLREEFAKQN